MDEPRFNPRPEFKAKLDAATPNPRDFVLYCRHCEWIGETNAVHAGSSRCAKCFVCPARIWRH